jgi:hypothetical protein
MGMTETGRKTEDAVISIPAQEKKQVESEEIETRVYCHPRTKTASAG